MEPAIRFDDKSWQEMQPSPSPLPGQQPNAIGMLCTKPSQGLLHQHPRPHQRQTDHNACICMVRGCGRPLIKAYNRKCRVCCFHMKCDEIEISSDLPIHRYCQKCVKVHPLEEFDSGKRSCRISLERHNTRQKKARALKSLVRAQKTLGLGLEVRAGDAEANAYLLSAAAAAAAADLVGGTTNASGMPHKGATGAVRQAMSAEVSDDNSCFIKHPSTTTTAVGATESNMAIRHENLSIPEASVRTENTVGQTQAGGDVSLVHQRVHSASPSLHQPPSPSLGDHGRIHLNMTPGLASAIAAAAAAADINNPHSTLPSTHPAPPLSDDTHVHLDQDLIDYCLAQWGLDGTVEALPPVVWLPQHQFE